MQRRGEGFERERIPPEPQEMREEPYRASEPYREMAPYHDLTHWSSVLVGFFTSLSVIVLVGVLGAALGFNTGVNVGIWAAVTLIVGFFCGGWFAARTCSVHGTTIGLIQGLAVWALTVTFLLVAGAFGAGAFLSMIGLGPVSAPDVAPTPGGMSIVQLAGWGAFVALILGLVASAIGGWVGGLSSRGHLPSPLMRR